MRRELHLARFEARTSADSGGCLLWLGRVDKYGYGRSSARLAHRISYELFIGPIPAGMEIDHLCRNTMCVNPEHLEPVTRAENMRRRAAAQTHCGSGHEFTPENTHLNTRGTRDCKTCWRARSRAYAARKRAAA